MTEKKTESKVVPIFPELDAERVKLVDNLLATKNNKAYECVRFLLNHGDTLEQLMGYRVADVSCDEDEVLELKEMQDDMRAALYEWRWANDKLLTVLAGGDR